MGRGREESESRAGTALKTLGSVWVLAAAAAQTATAGAQEVRLGEPLARYEEAFGLLGGIRELPDGSVIVADPMGVVLMKLDADLAGARPLGREGQGPGEYRQPDAVWPLGGDATLLVDLGNARLTRMDAEGRLGESTSMMIGGGGPGLAMALPGGTDERGGVYFQGSPMGPGGVRDSVEVMRLDLADGSTREVARVKAGEVDRQESGGANNQQVRIRPIPLSPVDDWAVTPEGGVYLVRVGDYSVEYVGPDGTRARGAAARDVRRVPIRGAEREEWAERRAREGSLGVSVEEVNGRRSVSVARRGGGGATDDLSWPDTKPYFEDGSARVDGKGRLWVRRSLPAGESALYDVFDRSGARVGSVRFPENRTLAGFGREVLYAAAIDELDQSFLERYALPM